MLISLYQLFVNRKRLVLISNCLLLEKRWVLISKYKLFVNRKNVVSVNFFGTIVVVGGKVLEKEVKKEGRQPLLLLLIQQAICSPLVAGS